MSRPKRWMNAVSAGQSALAALRELAGQYGEMKNEDKEHAEEKFTKESNALEEAFGELTSIKEEYEEWYSNMPEGLRQGPTGEKLDTIINLDTDICPEELSDEMDESWLDDAENKLDECENAELPRGFGRD